MQVQVRVISILNHKHRDQIRSCYGAFNGSKRSQQEAVEGILYPSSSHTAFFIEFGCSYSTLICIFRVLRNFICHATHIHCCRISIFLIYHTFYHHSYIIFATSTANTNSPIHRACQAQCEIDSPRYSQRA